MPLALSRASQKEGGRGGGIDYYDSGGWSEPSGVSSDRHVTSPIDADLPAARSRRLRRRRSSFWGKEGVVGELDCAASSTSQVACMLFTWLDCSPPTKANRVQSPAGSLRIFADRRVFSGFSCFPFLFVPALLHTHLALPSSALKTSMLRVAQISSLTLPNDINATSRHGTTSPSSLLTLLSSCQYSDKTTPYTDENFSSANQEQGHPRQNRIPDSPTKLDSISVSVARRARLAWRVPLRWAARSLLGCARLWEKGQLRNNCLSVGQLAVSNYIYRRWLLISDRDFEQPISAVRNELHLDLQSSSELEWRNSFLSDLEYDLGSSFEPRWCNRPQARHTAFVLQATTGTTTTFPLHTLASHQGESGSIPGRVTVEIVRDDAVGLRVFSVISRFPRPFIPATYSLQSPSSALQISLLRAARISPLTDEVRVTTGTSSPRKPFSFLRPGELGENPVRWTRCPGERRRIWTPHWVTASEISPWGPRPPLPPPISLKSTLRPASPASKNGGNGRTSIEPADQRGRSTRFPLEKIRELPGQALDPVRFGERRAV
ncbi:hypothetical protein PR048_031324 [Dryococelus australis]|uniref:Uncharacterized protein n=1 Tax=Dryococelus australis TaxID=614101 RepID=A0ABQ9G7T8_9NEOP|nr:hypothetical protein PR048_031324 [Dryococelus australis]